jgi:hypothetical protein
MIMKKIIFLSTFILFNSYVFAQQDCNQVYNDCQSAFSNAVNDASNRNFTSEMSCIPLSGSDVWGMIRDYSTFSFTGQPSGWGGLWGAWEVFQTAVSMWDCLSQQGANFGAELNNYYDMRCACFGSCGGC